MGRTACTEPQCLYNGALYLYFYLPLSQLSRERNYILSVYFLRKYRRRAGINELLDKDKLLKKVKPKQLII
jgi:hypothetical protein